MPFVPILPLFSVRLRDVKVSDAVTVRKALYAVMVVSIMHVKVSVVSGPLFFIIIIFCLFGFQLKISTKFILL